MIVPSPFPAISVPAAAEAAAALFHLGVSALVAVDWDRVCAALD